jgi:hypothetical protein
MPPSDQLIEEQIRGSKRSGDRARERVPKWSKEAFNDKLRKVKCTLENRDELRKNSDVGKRIRIRFQSGPWYSESVFEIRIREGKNDPTKLEKSSRNFMF